MPLHNCGMSARNQASVKVLIEAGADIEAVDSYNFSPLHRMASNNLAEGARMLLEAGADPLAGRGETAASVARSSHAVDVLRVLESFGPERRTEVQVQRLVVEGAGNREVDGEYAATPASEVPAGFGKVCASQGWDTASTWKQLNGDSAWFKAANGAYIYRNVGDGCWWIDAPNGDGAYKGKGPSHAPPAAGYEILGAAAPAPASIRIFRA